jgi:predicted ribosomally synthesized peptide with nif11-like leader
MSLDNVKRFLEAASSDPGLQSALSAARDQTDLGRIAVDSGAKLGLPFTAQEFLSTVASTVGGSGELSDDELAGVAGGTAVSRQPTLGSLLSVLKNLLDTNTPAQNAAASLSPSQRA